MMVILGDFFDEAVVNYFFSVFNVFGLRSIISCRGSDPLDHSVRPAELDVKWSMVWVYLVILRTFFSIN